MSEELCRVTIETNDYYRTLDDSDYEEYFDDNLDEDTYYATMHPAPVLTEK